MAISIEECADEVGALTDRIYATVREWGALSVPTLAVRLSVAPLHVRDAVDVDERLVLERDQVHAVETCTQKLVEAHLAAHGSATLEQLAFAVGRHLADVRLAVRCSKKLAIVTGRHDKPGYRANTVIYRGPRA